MEPHTHELSDIESILGEYGEVGFGGVLEVPLVDSELKPCSCPETVSTEER